MNSSFRCIHLLAAIALSTSAIGLGAATTYERVALVADSKTPPMLRDRIAQYLRGQYEVPVHIYKGVPAPTGKSSETLDVLSELVSPQDVCLVALLHWEGVSHQGMLFESKRCGVINLAALKSGPVDNDDESFERRAEKETLRAVALLLGVPACPFPRCALLNHRDDGQLDFKSRNPCPPCMEKIKATLTARGLAPVMVSPKQEP